MATNTNVTALTNATKSVKTYEKVLDDLDKRISSLDKNSKKYLTTLQKLQTERGKASRNLKASLENLKKVNEATKKAVSEGAKFKASTKSVTKALDEANKKLSETAKKTNQSSSAMSRFGKKIGTLAQYYGAFQVITLAVNALKAVIIGSMKAATEFEKAMAKVQVVTGATSKEMEELTKANLKAAGSTRYTAIQIAELQKELSKLGFSAREVTVSTLQIAQVAAALDAPLGTTAERIGQITRAYSLSAEEIGGVGDTLINTINNSALTLDKYATAFQYIGPVAKQAGVSLDTLSASMGLLADNGFTASRIGTGLRGIFLELAKEGKPAIFTLKDMADRMKGVGEYTGAVGSELLRTSDIVEVFGKRAAAQALILLDNVDVLSETEDSYDKVGAALKASAIELDTVSGRLDILSSAWVKTQISIGEFLLQNETVFDALASLTGLLDSAAEGQIRFNRALAELPVDGEWSTFKTLNEYLKDIVINGRDVDSVVNEIIKSTNEFGLVAESPKSLEIFQEIKERARETGKTLEEVFNDTNYWSEKGRASSFWNALVGNVNLSDVEELIRLFDQGVKVIGDGAKASEDEVKAREARLGIEKEYAVLSQEAAIRQREFDKLDKDSARAREIQLEQEKALDKALDERGGIRERIAVLQDLELERTKQGLTLTVAENAEYQALKNTLAQLTNLYLTINEADEKRKKRVTKVRFDDTAYKLEAKEIKNRIKLLNEQYKQDSKFAKNNEERREVEVKYLKELQTEQENLVKAADKYADAIEDWKKNNEKYKNSLDPQQLKNYNNELDRYEKTLLSLKKLAGTDNVFKFATNLTQADLKDGIKDIEKYLDIERSIFSSVDLDGKKSEVKARIENRISDIRDSITDPEALAAFDEWSARFLNHMDNELDKIEKDPIDWDAILVQGLDEAFSAATTALNAFGDVELENLKSRMEREKGVIKDRYDYEADVLKSRLEGNLISQTQYEQEMEDLNKEKIAKENEVNRKIFEAEQERDKKAAAANLAEALAKMVVKLVSTYGDPATVAIMSAVSGGIATAAYASELAAINSREFVPVQFEQGGYINGASHANGGVMAGVRGSYPVELEGGEFIVNKKATELNRPLLEAVNSQGGTPVLNNTSRAGSDMMSKQLVILEEIALATNATFIETSKPKKSYITEKDIKASSKKSRIELENKTL